MDRTLILMESVDWESAEAAVESARQKALYPGLLSFGLILQTMPDAQGEARMRAIPSLLCAVGTCAYEQRKAFWRGENNILMIDAGVRFAFSWDVRLRAARNACRTQSVLTGVLPDPGMPVEAVCAIGLREGGRTWRLGAGLAMRYAAHSMKSAFANPRFLYGPARFFQEIDFEKDGISVQALEMRWDLYTMREPILKRQYAQEEWEETPEEGKALAGFAQHFGMDLEQGTFSAELHTGIPVPDLMLPQHVPLSVRIQEAFRRLFSRDRHTDPLLVTACVSLPGQQVLTEESLAAFRRLVSMQALSVLCYADDAHLERLLRFHPNVLSFQRRYALDGEWTVRGENVLRYLELSRIHMLLSAQEKFPGHTHYAFIDMDYQAFPVYEKAALDLQNLCTDRIVMASTGGKADLSLICVPERFLSPLARAVSETVQQSHVRGRLPDAESVWESLIRAHSDWFTLIPLPGPRQLLSLTMLSRAEEWRLFA